MFNGFSQGASQIAQGASLYVLNRKEPDVKQATVVNVSQPHVSKAAQANPAAALQGFVIDLTLSMANDTTTIEFPVNSASANYPDKGWFVSTDRQAVIREVEAINNVAEQIISQAPAQKEISDKCKELLVRLNPEKQKEEQQAQEIMMLKNQLAEMNSKFDQLVGLLSANNPKNIKKKED